MNQPEFKVMLRLNNTIYRCAIHNKFFNIFDKPAYAVQIIAGIVQDPATKQPAVTCDACIVCEDCYKDKQYSFKEPSPIIVPKADDHIVKDSIMPKSSMEPKKV